MTHMMRDNSFLTKAGIESKLRDAESALKQLHRIEKVVGRLGISDVQLFIDGLRREWGIGDTEKKATRMELFATE